MKLNTDSMIEEFKPNQWYRINLLIDKTQQRVSIYVSEENTKPI